ncbi:energy-coupling factor transporter transmembrane protein EcfT [Shouchella sp. JSM 1781072]|uniref:energy-coupling factor transporter transmembrane component T family protein n=1 Tax=Shouchella sp. JSM 1781072 TaxID=3344581 RepID=UPI0035C18F48
MTSRKSLVVGDYIERDSIIHALDPRVKLISTFLFALVLFFVTSMGAIFVASLLVGVLIGFSRLPVKMIIRSLMPVAVFLIVFSLFQVVVIQEGQVLFSIGPLAISDEGITMASLFMWRTLMLFLIAIVMTATTSSYQLTQGIELLLNPLKNLRVPVRDLATMVSISLRFIPILRDELHLVQQAQRARGYIRYNTSIKNRIKLFIPLLVPLLVRALKRAEELGEAMEARGYSSRGTYTMWKQKKWQGKDSCALSVSIVVACLVLWL